MIRKQTPLYLKSKRPLSLRLKLNVDGISNPFTRRAGEGGIMRDDQGELIWGFHKDYGPHTSLFAELSALHDGLRISCDKGHAFFDVETDSAQVKDMVECKQGPWHLQQLIESISRLMVACRADLFLIKRQQNAAAADELANMNLRRNDEEEFNNSNVPARLKAIILLLEKFDLGYIRT